MVKNQIIVESVVSQGLGVRATAKKYGVSPAWVSTLVSRYRTEGPSAFVARSKRPHSNKLATPPAVEDRIIELRKDLLDIGTDAGADTIHTHLEREGFAAPSISTIQRILTRRGFVTPQPKKRPKSSYVRFVADLPNECWQTDMTHWHLEDGTGVEILTFLDDHSRLALAVRAYPTVTMENVRRLFRQSCVTFGTPASVLSDNGAIYNGDDRLAMYIDSVHRTNRVTVERIANEAARWGMPRKRAMTIVVDLLERVPAAITAARDETEGVPKEMVSTIEDQLAQMRSSK